VNRVVLGSLGVVVGLGSIRNRVVLRCHRGVAIGRLGVVLSLFGNVAWGVGVVAWGITSYSLNSGALVMKQPAVSYVVVV
jgi:hypothetical protein